MRPLDLQDNLSKAPLVSREQGIQQSSPDLAQRHGAQALDRQHLLDQSRLKAGDDADDVEHRVDDHPGEGGHGQRRRRQPGAAPTDADAAPERPRVSAHSRQIDLMA